MYNVRKILSPSSSVLLLAKTITHPAARSLCDSWASCSFWVNLQKTKFVDLQVWISGLIRDFLGLWFASETFIFKFQIKLWNSAQLFRVCMNPLPGTHKCCIFGECKMGGFLAHLHITGHVPYKYFVTSLRWVLLKIKIKTAGAKSKLFS